jgi:hypothetical protein
MTIGVSDITTVLRAHNITVHHVAHTATGSVLVILEQSKCDGEQARTHIRRLPGVKDVEIRRPWLLFVYPDPRTVDIIRK